MVLAKPRNTSRTFDYDALGGHTRPAYPNNTEAIMRRLGGGLPKMPG